MHAGMLNMQLALQLCVVADVHAAGLIFRPCFELLHANCLATSNTTL